MSLRGINSVGDKANIDENGYIKGDIDPNEFSYLNIISREDLLKLLLRNGKVKKATVWFAGEATRERIEFRKEQPITGKKHGKDYPFEKFNDWLEWNGFWIEVVKAVFWSLLFGESVLIFYDGKELENPKFYKTLNKHLFDGSPEKNDFLACKAFYPITSGNGYEPMDVDANFGNPATYKINLTLNKAKEGVEYYVSSNRVVRFNAPQLSLKYAGTSTVSQVVKDALVQEQIKRAISVTMNLLQAGIEVIKAANEVEKTTIEDSIGDHVSHLRRVYVKDADEVEKIFKLIVPDMKIAQFADMNEILQKDIASGIDMSVSNLEGSPMGQQSSAAYDTLNTYSKIKQIQKHYTRPFEESFYKLGKDDTTFDWVDPTPQLEHTGVSGPGVNDPDETANQPANDSNDPKKEEKENE